MKNINFGTKILLGFSLLLVILAGVSIESYRSLSDSSDGFHQYRSIALDTNLAGRIQANMLMARMEVKNYIISAHEDDLNKFKAYFDKTNDFLQEAHKQIEHPQRQAIIDEVDAALKKYQTGFDRVSTLMGERNHLVKDILDVKGPYLEQTLSKALTLAYETFDQKVVYELGVAMNRLLMGRLYMVKFLDTNDPEHPARIRKEFETLIAQLDAMDSEVQHPELRRLLSEVKTDSKTYLDATNKLADVIETRNNIITNTLDGIGPLVAEKIEDVKLSYKAEQDKLGPKLVASNTRSKKMITGVSVAAILLGLLLSFLITRGVTRPVKRVLDFSETLKLGDLSAVLPEGKDEFGRMGASLNALVETMREKADAASQIAKGKLDLEIHVASDRDTLGRALHDMVKSLNEMIHSLISAAEQVNAGSLQVSDSSQSLSQGATEQAASLEEITSSMTQIAAQTKTNAENASQANQLALETRGTREAGARRMEEMITAMADISASSKEIQKIIKAIDDIAFQTNLLALNAAVEAARAGKHGKGFAVVAQEVRTLAARSAKAAQETAELIETSGQKVTDGNRIAEDTKKALEEMNARITKVTDLVGEIAAASSEQAQGISQVNQGLAQIDGVTQQNTANAEETSSASEELASQAGYVRQILSGFELKFEQTMLPETSRPSEPTATVIPMKPKHGNIVDAQSEQAPAEAMQQPQDVIALDDREFGKY